jgi:hypothetical protein
LHDECAAGAATSSPATFGDRIGQPCTEIWIAAMPSPGTGATAMSLNAVTTVPSGIVVPTRYVASMTSVPLSVVHRSVVCPGRGPSCAEHPAFHRPPRRPPFTPRKPLLSIHNQ